MKIMDSTDNEGDCQIEKAIISKVTNTKKTKQARLPFQTLSSDSPVANKKRKSQASPDVRNAKQAKVNTKENSFKASGKDKTKDSKDVEEKIIEEKEENKTSEAEDVNGSKEKSDSKNKKNTPGKGTPKSRKSESCVQSNSLTKFLKKVDDKSIKNTESDTIMLENKEVESNEENGLTKNTLSSTKKEARQKNEDSNEESNNSNETKSNPKTKTEKKSTSDDNMSDSDMQEITEENSDDSDDSLSDKDPNDTENMDVDSDVNILSDDSPDDDEDDDSLTDSKRTEHEDTDSKDDINREAKIKSSTPSRDKLINSETRERKLTPKQLEKKLEMQKKREMREKQRQEREKKLQEERENRKKEKEEKKKEREEKRKEREEKEKMLKEQKRKEKEMKELKKQAEIEQKQKEKEAKEEDRRKREEAKEEERKRKEEEKLEAERKKQKAASNFVSFFVPKKSSDTKPIEEEKKTDETSYFMPFEVKADMRVAPLCRRNFSNTEKIKLDNIVSKSALDKSKLYINEIKSNNFKIRKSTKTWPFELNDDIIVLDEDEESANVVQAVKVEKHRAKLLMFHENRRPPYWGTWRKKSKNINPRRPLAKDSVYFDYEIDSDEEWEEEEEGESLRGSDDEKEKDEDNEENEYDVDNDFMVPHGYLSDEEILADEEEDDDDDINPEKQKTKLKLLGEQFEEEMKTKTKKLKPKVIGCIWLNENSAYPENTPEHTVQYLTARQAWTRGIPLVLTAPADADKVNDECSTPSSKHGIASSARKAKALEEAMPDLIRLFHGNTQSRGFLVKEFLEYWSKKKEGEKTIPKLKIHQKVHEITTRIACPEPGPMQDKLCWWVSQETITKYLGDEKLSLPNNWTYTLTPKKKQVPPEPTEKIEEKEKEKDKKTAPLITQFTKTLTAEEKQKQLSEKGLKSTEKPPSTNVSKPTPPANKPPKRAALISVPRGEPLPKSPRVSLMDKFVKKDGNTESKKNDKTKSEDLDEDDCMIIDSSDEKVDVLSVSVNSKTEEKQFSEDEDNSDKPGNVSKNSDVDVIEI